VGEIRLGQNAFFTVQAFPGKTFRGRVSQIRRGPITVQNVVTYDVVVAVPNPDRSLFPGMTADMHIVIEEHDDVLRVPLPAIRFTPEGFAQGRGGGHGGEDRAAQGRVEGRAEGKGGARNAHRGRVWVMGDNGSLKPVPVGTGIDDGSLIEVSGEGLQPGDKVVVNEAGAEQRRPQTGPGQNQFLRQPGGPRL
jgi:HlyD family secretion protein